MTIEYRIDHEAGIIRTTVTGIVTDDHVVASKRKLRDDPHYVAGMPNIVDVRAVERLEVTPHGIQQMAAMDNEAPDKLSGRKLAIVANSDLVYGMGRMYQQTAGDTPQTIGIFRTMDEAEAWLGLAGPA